MSIDKTCMYVYSSANSCEYAFIVQFKKCEYAFISVQLLSMHNYLAAAAAAAITTIDSVQVLLGLLPLSLSLLITTICWSLSFSVGRNCQKV